MVQNPQREAAGLVMSSGDGVFPKALLIRLLLCHYSEILFHVYRSRGRISPTKPVKKRSLDCDDHACKNIPKSFHDSWKCERFLVCGRRIHKSWAVNRQGAV